ncbi:MAG: ABC transporter ATP-binding protein [Patescibacteria group bacterium]|nr:ABC transporter ATP-binding protein [Patescibacteria group bacterium]
MIEAAHVGKRYDIIHQRGRYVSLRDVMMNIVRSPFKILSTKVRRAAGIEKREEFWALRDVSFSIGRGEVVGIIGRNGAGKSTLLKILSQITPPTTGEIAIRGKIGSLLEVGTGFHPELTGRENIFLNGAILGMARREIARKFDEIVTFAGVEKFLDTPVKHYSSGMYVRLAFSVAAHMEPDILIVDEVLAVGDAEFQKRCLGKMDEITKKDGRTILFVSHNMGAIRELCKKTILMENGRIKDVGPTEKVIDGYLGLDPAASPAKAAAVRFDDDPAKQFQIGSISVRAAADGMPRSSLPIEEQFFIDIECVIRDTIDSVCLIIVFSNDEGRQVANFMELDSDPRALAERKPGTYRVRAAIPGIFNIGSFGTRVIVERGDEVLDSVDGPLIRIVDNKPRSYRMELRRAPLIPKAVWTTDIAA